MTRTHLIWIVAVIALLSCGSALAVQPTMETNKIFLNPFYRASMTNNVNSTYNITVMPPDGISSVTSAIISFDMWMTPTVTFSAWVNGQTCNNANYTITTTFASAGRGVATFDCSNRITKAGTYNVTIRPSGANTGSLTAWLDLTYMNRPFGGIEVSGTEYSPGDQATNFVQLKDSQGIPIQNGSCYMDIWYPLVNGTHPYTVQDAPMLVAPGDDGIYYYDLIAPSTLGVYMLSARCSYSYNPVWIYRPTELLFFPVRSVQTGTYQGASIVLNAKEDGLYERCDGSIAQPCVANYTFNMSQYGLIDNITGLNVYYMGQSDTASRTLTLSYWNGSTFVNMTNTLTYAGTGGSVPTPYDELLSNTIPASAIVNNQTIIRFSVPGSVRIFNNWLALLALSSVGTLQDVKGSGEMHVTNISGAAGTVAASSVWSYATRNLTYTPDMTNYSQIQEMNWNATNRSLTVAPENTTAIANAVWAASSRNLTYFPPQVDLTNYTLITNNVWGYTGNVSSSLLSQFTSSVWSYASRYVHGVLI